MTSAAAAEIEECKGPVTITVGKKLLYITIDFIVMHVVMIEHLIVNRPLVEKIVRSIFLAGFHFFDSFQGFLPEAHLGCAALISPFHVIPTIRRLCTTDPVDSRELQSPMWTREYRITSCYFNQEWASIQYNLVSFCA